MHQQARPVEVAQESVAEARARVRPSIEPGDVGDDERPLARQPDRPEVRHQRRERVVGDLGARRGDAGDQRRLADVRETEQADVGEQLELEAHVRSWPGVPGSALRGARSVDVAKWMLPRPPLPPWATTIPLAVRAQIANQARRSLVEHLRPGRDAQHHVFAGAAIPVLVGARSPDGAANSCR